MTSYDEIIDLALISIEDYKLNNLASYIDESNYDLVVASSSYALYLKACEDANPPINPTLEKNYNYIKSANFDNYEEYVDDAMKNLKSIMDGYMIRGLPNFNNCKKDLSQRNNETREFNIVLNDMEKSIISDYTVLMWLDKEINDVSQITGMIQNKTQANRFSEANLLDKKMARRIDLRESINKKQIDYSFINVPWTSWADGKYDL